ncbi:MULTISPECIES: RNA polymerase sigma factor [Subtercola]|uniref:RNA polymerase sigma factor n=1 Tax=Subtercola vilae TaxID=2056433 RepID=A0A4T2BPE7_9MICO|nr:MULTISPECIES: sigma-70 family RNA polymerase sigma factor [Subtercola]MEA9986139.1 sigma-70 family RNA polymerase sigma factor [Subtercola sp. RTI3]TIH33573.1 sigma-70 family RNA polymerase sigma factor [Subtercola vilae]
MDVRSRLPASLPPARASVLDEADDRTLAGRAADGDVRAFEVIVRRYSPLMRAYATRVLGSNSESDDVVQEAFITAWQQLPSLNDGGVVKSWLMRIVSRKSIDRIRARKLHLDIDDHEQAAPHTASPHHVAEVHSRETALSAALNAMPEQQRQCWVLKELAEYSYDDIARELDLPLSTVRGLLARARKNLIRQMEEWR